MNLRLDNNLSQSGFNSQDRMSDKKASAEAIKTFEDGFFLTAKNHTSNKSSTDIKGMKQSFQSSFTQLAKNKEGFYKLLDQAFGTNYDRDAAEGIRNAAINGDFSWLPEATVLDNDEFSTASLNGGNKEGGVFLGAFDKSNHSILINNSVLSNKGLANSVYAEEAGHALDNILNRGTDAKGDEGAIFSKLLSGEVLTTKQLENLRSENDHGVMGGKSVEFDFWQSVADVFNTDKNWDKIDRVYYTVREHIFAIAYYDVAEGNNDIGSKDPKLNNAENRQQVLIERARASYADPANQEKKSKLREIITIIADQHGINDNRYRVDFSGDDLRKQDKLENIISSYDQHVIEEAAKGNFLLNSEGYTFFREFPNKKHGSSGHWMDVDKYLSSYSNKSRNVALAFAHNDVVLGVEGAVGREKALISGEISSKDIIDRYLESGISGADAEKLLYQHKLHGWVTNNIFELLSHDANVGNDATAKNLKLRLSEAFHNRDSNPDTFNEVLREATLRYAGLNIEEINQRVSKGLGFEEKVQEFAENSPESLKVFIQFYYEKVNEELIKRGQPTVELKPGFVDELITKLTSSDATVKTEGQSTVTEMFGYVEQLDIGTQKEAYSVYQNFQNGAQVYAEVLRGLDDEALENYIHTFIQITDKQNPGVAVDYGDDPVGSIVKLLGSNTNTPENRKELEGIYAFVSQQLAGNHDAKKELGQIIDKQTISNQIVVMVKNNYSIDDYARVLFGLKDDADFTPEQRAAIDNLIASIKGGDPTTYKEALNGAYELVKSLDTKGRARLDSEYNSFQRGFANKQKLLPNLVRMAAEDPKAFHAYAEKLLDEEYNYEAVENVRINGGSDDVISGILEKVVGLPGGDQKELNSIIDESQKKGVFQVSYFSMATNKALFHKANKVLLDDPKAAEIHTYNEVEIENYRLEIVRAIESKDVGLLEQLMAGKYEIIKDVSEETYNEFISISQEFSVDKAKRASDKSKIQRLAGSKPEFELYVKTLLGDDYSDKMKPTIEEWRVTIRDKKEGYEDLLSTAFDIKENPDNTNKNHLDYLLNKFDFEETLIKSSKNEDQFVQYVDRYLQAVYPDGNYPTDVQTLAEELLADIKAGKGHQALADVYDQQILFDAETKKDLFSIISISRAETNFKTKFTALAKTPDKFNTFMEKTYGQDYNKENTEAIRIKASEGDFSWMPEIKVLGNDIFAEASLNGDTPSSANYLGAFDGNNIILNEGILFDSKTLERVLTQEIGHALDREVNDGKDAKGDEGEIFQRLLSGEELSESQLVALRDKEDHGVLAGLDVEFDASNAPVTIDGVAPSAIDVIMAEDGWVTVSGGGTDTGRFGNGTGRDEAPSNELDVSGPVPDNSGSNTSGSYVPPYHYENPYPSNSSTGSQGGYNPGNNGYGSSSSSNSGSNSGSNWNPTWDPTWDPTTSTPSRPLRTYDNSNSVAEAQARHDSIRNNRNSFGQHGGFSDPADSPIPYNDPARVYSRAIGYSNSYSSPTGDISFRPNSGVVITNPSLLGLSPSVGNRANTNINPAFTFNPEQAVVQLPETEPTNPPSTDTFSNPNKGIPMRVLPGDTSLQKIADRYNISVDHIKAVNPGLTDYSGDKLRVGDSIILPLSASTNPEIQASVTLSPTQLLAFGDDVDLNTLFKTGGRLGLSARGQTEFIGLNASIFAEAFIEKLRKDGKLEEFLDDYVPDSPLTTKDREYDAIKKMTQDFSGFSESNGTPDSGILQDALVANGGLDDLKVTEGTRFYLPLSVYKDVPVDSPFYKEVLNAYAVEGLMGPLDGSLTHVMTDSLGISTTDLVDELHPGQSSEMIFRLNHDGSLGPIQTVNNNALKINVALDDDGSYIVTTTSLTNLGVGIGASLPIVPSALGANASGTVSIPEGSINVYKVDSAEDAKKIVQLAERQANTSMLAINDPVDEWNHISGADQTFLNDHSVQKGSLDGLVGNIGINLASGVIGFEGYTEKAQVLTRLERDNPTKDQTSHEVSLARETIVGARPRNTVVNDEDFITQYSVNSVLTVSHNGEKWDDYTDTTMVSLSFKDIRRPGAVEMDNSAKGEAITPRYNIDPTKLDLSSDTFKDWYFGDGRTNGNGRPLPGSQGHKASFLSYAEANGVSRNFDEANPPPEVRTLLAAYTLEMLPIQPHNPELMGEIVASSGATPSIQNFNASHQYFSDIFGKDHLSGISIDYERTGGNSQGQSLEVNSPVKPAGTGVGASVSHVVTNATTGGPLGHWELGN